MPELTRPDGVRIHWRERGSGDAIVLSHHWLGSPDVLEGLLSDLARDYRVITYDPRGTGDSTRQVSHDADSDLLDLSALLEEPGEPTSLIGWGGDGAVRAVQAAAARPDLCGTVVAIGAMPLGQAALLGTDSPAESEIAQDAMGKVLRTNYKAALRQMIEATTLPMSESKIKQRVDAQLAYCDQEAAIARYEAWRSTDVTTEARRLGERLWIVLFETGLGSADRFAARARELVPDAHVLIEAEGPVYRPDLTATVVRRATAPLYR